MEMQSGWRWCSKCQGFFFASGASVCPGGGAHDGEASSAFLLPTGDDAAGQSGWLWCKKCQGLFFGTGPSVCPAGDAHDGSESTAHALPLDSMGGTAQAGWAWCKKCQGLFFATGPSACPAGEGHDGSDSSAFFAPLAPAPVPAPAPEPEPKQTSTPTPPPSVFPPSGPAPEPVPATKDLVWVIWYDNTDAHRADHDVGLAGLQRQLAGVLPKVATAKIWLYETAKSAAAFASPPPVVDFTKMGEHPDAKRLLAIVLLGSFPWWESYSGPEKARLAELGAVLRTTEIPILGFCGGHQLVAKAFAGDGPEPVGHVFASDDKRDKLRYFGSDAEFSAALERGEYTETYLPREASYDDENAKAKPVTLTADGQKDDIYAYLGAAGARREPQFMFWHHDEVKILHPDFILLASTALSKNQSLKHKSRLIYTTQFHPEQSGDGLDGDGYVQTFFRLAARYWLAKGA